MLAAPKIRQPSGTRWADLCGRQAIERWEDFVGPDQQRRFFKDGQDPHARRIITFWAALEEPLAF